MGHVLYSIHFTPDKQAGQCFGEILSKNLESDYFNILISKMNKSIFIAFTIASLAVVTSNAGIIDHVDHHPDQLSSSTVSHSDHFVDSFGSLTHSGSETEDASKVPRQKRAELNLHYGIGGGGFGRYGGYRGENRKKTKT